MNKQALELELQAPDKTAVKVSYVKSYLGGSGDFPPTDHFEFRGIAISSTGYRSHFIHGGIEAAEPEDVATFLIKTFFDERVKEGYQPGQTTLF